MRLWYRKPAKKWEEALPIGNGRMGAMVFGNLGHEVLKLNEDSIWSGKPVDRINPDAYKKLPKIRELLRKGRIPEAEQMAIYALSGTPNSERSYQTAGELQLFFQNVGNEENYIRELDLEEGIVKISYEMNGVNYRREAFASYPDSVIVYRMEALSGRQPESSRYAEDGGVPEGGISFDARIGRGYNELDEAKAQDDCLIRYFVDGGKGISFSAAARSIAEGGRQETIGEHLLVRDAKAVTLLVAINTSFRGADYEEKCLEQLKKASGYTYEELRARHVEDHQAHFGRLRVKVGEQDWDLVPTDERLQAVKSGAKDFGLCALHFQYGRYLLFASSRPGSLPANLQGVWNESMSPPWGGKYTININLEMNYWIAESGNLPECHMAYFEHLKRVMERGKEVAERMYGCRGSVAHHNTDLYGDAAPQDHYIPASYWVMGEAWLATHIWEHYLYTGDEDFLEEYFDVLHQCVLFFADFLIEAEDGSLVTSPSVSPENTYILPDGTRGCMCEGPTMDSEILAELLTAYRKACRILGRDGAELAEDAVTQSAPVKKTSFWATQEEPVKKAAASEETLYQEAQRILEHLPAMRIGKYGQIQEWNGDFEEAEPGHRHISHLYALYPGTKLTGQDTPRWMEAARATLERRLSFGGGHTGWSRAWIIGLWARLWDGEQAEENYQALLAGSTFPNLMDNHPAGPGFVFQIDGNMGASAAFIEMLAQSHGGRIVLLPAVADGLDTGEIEGVRLRGGITLKMQWKHGRVTLVELQPDVDQEISLTMNGTEQRIELTGGETWSYAASM